MSLRNPFKGDFATKVHASSYDYISPLQLDLSGRHVLITGAALEDGVGYATAKAFARAGASSIAIADLQLPSDELVVRLRSAAVEAKRPEPTIISFIVDIASEHSVRKLQQDAETALQGRLDVLVNNAAAMEPALPFLEGSLETYWRTYEVNVKGLFNMAHAFLPMLISTRNRDSGLCTMLNVASSGALTACPNSSAYRSSKLAILRWTESLQLEYGGTGLLTFCVNPGAIKTQISKGISPDSVRDRFPHTADLPGDTIAWLVSERREWLGGRYVSCPWDMEEPISRKEEVIEGDKLKMCIRY